MMLWIKLSLRNTLRNLRRTLLTVATILVGIALVVLSVAWLEGIFTGLIIDFTATSGHLRMVNQEFAEKEALQPLYANIPDVDPIMEAARRVPGVVAVEPRISVGVAMTATEEIGDHFGMVVGATDTWFRERLRGPDKLREGSWLTGGSKEVVLGKKIASDLEVGVGGEILLLGQTQYGSMSPVTARVVGIVGGDAMIDNQAYMPLEEIQWMADIPGGAVEILVYTEDYEKANVEAVAQRLQGAPGLEELTIQPWTVREPWATTLPVLNGMGGFVKALIVFMTALAIFNTMTMSVLERTGEIGVMRAMGLSRLGTMALFLVESLTIGLIGGIVGALVGALPAWYLSIEGVRMPEGLIEKAGSGMALKPVFYAALTPDMIIQGIILGLVIAVVGALLPAMRAASIQPVTAMHSRR